MSRDLVQHIIPQDWDSQKPSVGSGFNRTRWLQSTADLLNRPVLNRLTATTAGVAVNTNAANQSTGIGTSAQTPKRYAEFTVKARITFNINSTGPVYLTIFRTLGNVPANGSAPNGGDVAVGGDAFWGGATINGVNQAASFSFLDTGLDVTKKYKYYLAVNGPNGNVLNIVNTSQILVMERS